jgi:peptide/nickel transport system ATP-binding protein
MTAASVLEISQLSLSLERRGEPLKQILRGVDLAIAPGEVVGLVGESGGGKTMVGKAVLGILPPSARIGGGQIRFDGIDLLTLPAWRRRALLGRRIAMILQNPMTALNPAIRIEHQIVDVLQYHLKMSAGQARQRALALLDAVQIRDPDRVMRHYPHELSGGMCQRVIISIAFACEPQLIIADEPTTALDVTVQHQILRLIKELQERTGTAVLFITHDLGIVAKVCDHVNIIYGGKILESRPVEDLFRTPRHPYTRALLQAAPRYDRPDVRVTAVPDSLHASLQGDAPLEEVTVPC